MQILSSPVNIVHISYKIFENLNELTKRINDNLVSKIYSYVYWWKEQSGWSPMGAIVCLHLWNKSIQVKNEFS